ncbi:MAG: NADH-quinone oxidoreductase subunit L [Actinobacteria bacterium]|nr:NADH-quinone oxidoreductase subunit L [Actinomycetota bacterium]
MLTYAWIIPALPALSFVLILAVGKRLPKGGSEIGLATLAVCFVLAVGVGVGWVQRVNSPPKVDEAALTARSLAGQETTPSGERRVAPAGEAGAGALPGGARTGEGAAPGGEGSPAGAGAGEGGAGQGEAGTAEAAPVPAVVRTVTWFQSGGVRFTAGTMVDGLSAMMLVLVSLISLLVHVYSTDYVAGDRRYTHYFAFLSLFTASMLMFVLTQSTLQLIVGWELVGLCSFALIGHWWEEKPNSNAALKAFITNRVGDIGLIVGMIVLYFAAGRSFDIIRINSMANAGQIRHLLLLVASVSLIAAVMSKSGQFILHTWLPDAMAGPTPVSALIHAATMVVAGIYMVARLYPVFFRGLSIGTANINLLAVVGAVTLVFGALLAFVQSDIKKVLAYSTVSQLGYMVMALGVGGWTAALFHLVTHAFFKACLFLGAGSMSHACHHSFDMKKDYGGLRRRMPITFWTFMIGTGALVAIPPLSGFWSKDEILASANGLGGPGGYKIMLVMGIIGAFCTAGYMTRAVWYCFFGEPRGAAAEHPPRENGPRITVPLMVLAGITLVIGFVNVPTNGWFSWVPDGWALRFENYVQPRAAYFVSGGGFRQPVFTPWIAVVSTGAGLLGVLLAYLWFWRGLGPHGITARNRVARAGYRVLESRYGLDVLYTDWIVGSIKGPIARAAYWVNQKVLDGVVNGAGREAVKAGHFVYDRIDQGVVDTIVNGSGATAEGSGQILRKQQTGRVQTYGAYLFAGATVLAAIFVILAAN